MSHDPEYSASSSEIGMATDAALECLAWSEYDWDTERPLDSFEADFDPAVRESLRTELGAFIDANSDDLAGLDYSQIGHDFILTRNHHGAGFWDRGLGDAGDRLTDAAHAYGEIHAWLDGDTIRTE